MSSTIGLPTTAAVVARCWCDGCDRAVGASQSAETGFLEAKDRAVLDFATYEDYLDSQITERDLFYLEVTARGARGRGTVDCDLLWGHCCR